MDYWESKLGINKPTSCNRMAYCCKAAVCVAPWEKLAKAKYNQELKDFFNLFIPYESQKEAEEKFPDAYIACMEIAKTRKDIDIKTITFYYCRFLIPPNKCQIYEDRPNLCRNYPESPHDSIPRTCGYFKWSLECKKTTSKLKQELTQLKLNQFRHTKCYLISPALSIKGIGHPAQFLPKK